MSTDRLLVGVLGGASPSTGDLHGLHGDVASGVKVSPAEQACSVVLGSRSRGVREGPERSGAGELVLGPVKVGLEGGRDDASGTAVELPLESGSSCSRDC